MWKLLALSVWLLAEPARSQESVEDIRVIGQRLIPERFDNWAA